MIKTWYKKLMSERQRNRLRYRLYALVGFFYRGNRFFCVCCNTSFRRFFTYGNIPRPNALCPSCHSLERTRLLMYYIKNETAAFSRSLRILHFAPEKAIETNLKRSTSNYITADLNPELADMEMDVTEIRFPDESFDLVICSHVLGHVSNERKAIDELYRVTKINGKVLIMTVIDPNLTNTYENPDILMPEEKLKAYGEKDLVRRHGIDFQTRLKRGNMSVLALDYRQRFSKDEQKKFSLGNGQREMIFVCTRKN